MSRYLIKKHSSLFLVLAFVLSAIAIFSFRSFASTNTAPSPGNISPTNGQVFTAGSGNVATVNFRSSASDPDAGAYVRTQVMYRLVGTSRWTSFGTKSSEDPEGHHPATSPNLSSIPNGVRNAYINEYGWNCAMGWGANVPASCDTIYSNGSRSGKSAFPGYAIMSPGVSLAAGTYEWRVRGIDNAGAYSGGWSPAWRFTINPAPTPPATPVAPPATPATPSTPRTNTTPRTTRTTTPKTTAALPTPEDTEAPSIPQNPKGEYSQDEGSVILSWEPSNDSRGVEGYEVERTASGTQDWEKKGTVTKEAFKDFAVDAETEYQYRIRAYDSAKNYSEYSSLVVVKTGKFEPNINSAGGEARDESGYLTVKFPEGSVSEDLFIAIERVDAEVPLEEKQKIVGGVYEIKAKNSKGDEVTSLLKQVTVEIRYDKKDARGVNTKTLSIYYSSGEVADEMKTIFDKKKRTATTITDHFSYYYIAAEKTSGLATFGRVVSIILLLVALGFAGYFGYNYYQNYLYQKDHKDDFIYRH